MSSHLRHNIYRAAKSGNGHACQLEIRQTTKGWSCFLSMAKQVGSEEKKFNWKSKINVSLGLADLGEILATLRGRQEKCKLFHESPDGSNKIIELQESEKGGYALSVSQKKGSEAPNKMFIGLGQADAAILVLLIEKAVLSQCIVEQKENE